MCRNRRNLCLGAERACPEASKFENFILQMPLIFELKLFKPTIGIFISETRNT